MAVLDLRFTDAEWRPLLAGWDEKEVKKTLRRAAQAWGAAAKPIVKAQVPVAAPGNKYVTRGNLQRSVRAVRIRPRYGIGVVVGPIESKRLGTNPYYRHMVVGGTKPHLILPKKRGSRSIGAIREAALKIANGQYVKAVQHPGAKANPFIERARPAAEAAGHARAERYILRRLAAEQEAT